MFKATLPQEESFFETLSPQQKQQYLLLQQQKAAQASLQAQQLIEQRINQNVNTALQQEIKLQQDQQQQAAQPQTLQVITYNPNGITTTTPHPLQSSLVQINVPFTQIQVAAPAAATTTTAKHPLLDASAPGLFKAKLAQAPWRNLIASRYSKQRVAPKTVVVPPAPGMTRQHQRPSMDAVFHYLDSALPHDNISFVNGGDGSPAAQYVKQHPHHQHQQHQSPFGQRDFVDPFAMLFGLDGLDEFGMPHHPFDRRHRRAGFDQQNPAEQFDEFGRPLDPRAAFDPFGFPRDPFFDRPFGSMMMDPFDIMMGGRRGGMAMDPFARMGMGFDELARQAEATKDGPRPFGGASITTFSSSSSSSSDGVIKKTSSYSSNNNWDGKPKTKSWSSSAVTRVGPDGIARTEKSEEELADDGTLEGKKHRKVVSTEVEANPTLSQRFQRARRGWHQDPEAPVIDAPIPALPDLTAPVAEIQRIETDFVQGDTKIVHERRIGDKQHQHVTAISVPAPGAESFTQYDEVEGMSTDELNVFNEQFAQVAPKLTPQPPVDPAVENANAAAQKLAAEGEPTPNATGGRSWKLW